MKLKKMGITVKTARIVVSLIVILLCVVGSMLNAAQPTGRPGIYWQTSQDHGAGSGGFWTWWQCTGNNHNHSDSYWTANGGFYNPRRISTTYDAILGNIDTYNGCTVYFDGAGPTSVDTSLEYPGAPANFVHTNRSNLPYAIQWLDNDGGGIVQANPYTPLTGAYGRAIVEDMFILSGSYTFFGDSSAGIDTNPGNPQIIGHIFNPEYNNLTTDQGDTAGKLWLYTTGTTTFYVETAFEGGYMFDRGFVDLRHNYGLGYYAKASKGTTGRYLLGIPTNNNPFDITDHTTWRKKFDDQGLIEVRGNDSNGVVIGTSMAGASRTIQNRFEVASNKSLTFGVPYSNTATGGYPYGEVFAIYNVDTRGYLDTTGKDILGGAVYLALGAKLARSTGIDGRGETDRPGELFFRSNKAMRGGAIYAYNNLFLSGNTRFEGNLASEYGGAIYMAGDGANNQLHLDVREYAGTQSAYVGDILFKDNGIDSNFDDALDGAGTTAKKDYAIYLEKNTEILIDGNRYVYFDDAIQSGIGGGVGNSLTLNLTLQPSNGFIQFSDNTQSILNPSTAKGGHVNIISGEFRIIDAATFTTEGEGAFFDIAKDGILAGDGTLEAQWGFRVSGTISPDNYEYQIPTSLAAGEKPQYTVAVPDYIGFLKLKGNLTLTGGTLSVNLSEDQLNSAAEFNKTTGTLGKVADDILKSDMVLVYKNTHDVQSGHVYLSSTAKSTVNIVSWETGKYILAATPLGFFDFANNNAVDDLNIMNYFNKITLTAETTHPRRNAMLTIEKNNLNNAEWDLVLNTSDDGNVDLVWLGEQSNLWDNNEALLNWIRRDTANKLGFRERDLVYFDVTHNVDKSLDTKTIRVAPAGQPGWLVGGMVIEGGNYLFNNGKITGVTTADGLNATGRLDIQLTDTAATETNVILNVSTDFAKGTRISDATVTLRRDDSLGTYVNNADSVVVPPLPNTNEHGAVYVGATGKTAATLITNGNRNIQNHFEITNDSTLTLGVGDGGTRLTISGVDTTNSANSVGGIGHQGGAFYVSKNSQILRSFEADETPWTLILDNNKADDGGAIYAEQDLTIYGNTKFTNNEATNLGGAIYIMGSQALGGGKLTMDTTVGDISFSGNTDINGSNSVYIVENTTLEILGDNNVFFDDPINAGNEGRNNFVKNGIGIVQFQGANVLNNDIADNGRGVANINDGTFRLAGNGAAFKTSTLGTSARFNLNAGATLSGNGDIEVFNEGYKIVPPALPNPNLFDINIAGTVNPDSAVLSSGNLTITNGSTLGQLRFNTYTNVNLNGAVLNFDIGVNSNGNGNAVAGTDNDFIEVVSGNINLANTIKVNAQSGTATTSGNYLIVQADAGLFTVAGNANPTVAQLKALIDSPLLATSTSPRGGSGKLQFKKSGETTFLTDAQTGANEMWITDYTGSKNLKIWWTGKTNADWDMMTSENWRAEPGRGGVDTQFYDYDYVVFDDRNPQGVDVVQNRYDITLKPATVEVVGMDVLAGTYTISGQGVIKGDGRGNYSEKTGKLVVGGKGVAANLTLNVATEFYHGTELKDNGQITIGHDKALGVYDNANPVGEGYVHATGNGTIAASVDHTIKNLFEVDPDKNLTFDIAGKTLTVNNATESVELGSGATLTKTGAGNLVFTGAATAVSVDTDGTISANGGNIIFNANTGTGIKATGDLELNGNSATNIIFFDTANDKLTVGNNLSVKNAMVVINGNDSAVTGTTTVSDRANFVVTANKTFRADTNFELQNGATVSGNGTIAATNVTLNGIVDPVNKTYTYTGGTLNTNTASPFATLTFGGITTLNGATIQIDLGAATTDTDLISSTGDIILNNPTTLLFTVASGVTPTNEYKIVQSGGSFSDTADPMLYFSITGLGSSSRGAGYTLEFRDNGNTITAGALANELWLVASSSPNMDIYWTGKQGTQTDGLWVTDSTKENWRNQDNPPSSVDFITNDHVIFTNDALTQTTDVKLTAGDHQVNGMVITQTDAAKPIVYTFTNANGATGTIKGNPNTSLDITNAEATFGVELTFDKVNLSGTTKVTLDNTNGLQSVGTNGTLSVNGNSTLTAKKDYDLGHAIELNNGDLTIDADNKTLTLNKALSGIGNFTIDKGTVKFTDAANTINGDFAVNKDGTLTAGNGVTITANQFTLNGTVEVTQAADQLTLDGNATFDGATLLVDLSSGNVPIKITNGSATILAANGKNTIDVSNVDWNIPDHTIITTANGIKKIGGGTPTPGELNNLFTLQQNGKDLNAPGSRNTYDLILASGNNNVVLHLTKGNNDELYWTGSTDTAWDFDTTSNWAKKNALSTPTNFLDGDYVNFDDGVSGSNNIVNLGGAVRTVSGMRIIDGDFTFDNGTLKGTEVGSTYTGNKTAALDIDGNGRLTLNIETHFKGGIKINGNGDRTIVIGDNAALGFIAENNGDEGIVNIAADKNVTIETSGGSKTIDNRFNLKTGAKLTVNTSNGDLDLTNALNGDGNNAFIKAGSGTVTLNGTDNKLGANSFVTVAQGTLHVQAFAELNAGKTFTSNVGSFVKGTGKITAETLNISGTLVNGNGDANYANQTGTLTLNGNAEFENVQLNLDLKDGDTTNNIRVTNNAVFGDNNVIVLHTWKAGTYDLITAGGTMTGDPTAHWTIDKDKLPGSDRYTIDLKVTGSILQLTTSSNNEHLVWGDGSSNWDDKTWDLGKDKAIFIDGDAVEFNKKGSSSVNLNGDRTVADMVIKNGEYDFNGGDLFGKSTGTSLPGAKGALEISNSSKATFHDTVDFEGISVKDKASVTLADDGKLISRKNGQPNSGNIIFDANTTLTLTPADDLIHADGKVELNGKVTVNQPDNIVYGETTFERVITAGEALDELQLRSIFDRTWGLKGQEAIFVNPNQMDLAYALLTVSAFGVNEGFNHNMNEAAKGLDGAFAEGALGGLKDILYGFDTDEEVTDAIDQLRGTEMAASALAMSLWEPWTKVYKQLRDRDEHHHSHGIRGQESLLNKKREVWLEGYYRYLDVNSDGNAKKYYENRGGMVMGIDTKVHQFSTLGISFGYGNPKLSTKFGKVEAYDFTLALYGKTQIKSDLFLNGYAGLGFQEYKSDRYENIGTVSSLYKGKYNGNSGYVSLELYQPKKWNDTWTLFPLAALDYQRAWSAGYDEVGGHFAQSIHKSNVDRLVLRIGVDSKIQYSDSVNFLTRLQYGFMAGGDTRAKINSSFIGSTPTMEMTGVHLGRSQVDLGIGGEWYLDKRKCLKFFGDYDVDFGTRYAAQTGQLGLVVLW